jgi:hypothetical protein
MERNEDELARGGFLEVAGQTKQRVCNVVTSEAPRTDLGATADMEFGVALVTFESERRAVPHVLKILETLDRLPARSAQLPESPTPESLNATVSARHIFLTDTAETENVGNDCAPGDAIHPPRFQRVEIEPNIGYQYTLSVLMYTAPIFTLLYYVSALTLRYLIEIPLGICIFDYVEERFAFLSLSMLTLRKKRACSLRSAALKITLESMGALERKDSHSATHVVLLPEHDAAERERAQRTQRAPNDTKTNDVPFRRSGRSLEFARRRALPTTTKTCSPPITTESRAFRTSAPSAPSRRCAPPITTESRAFSALGAAD